MFLVFDTFPQVGLLTSALMEEDLSLEQEA